MTELDASQTAARKRLGAQWQKNRKTVVFRREARGGGRPALPSKSGSMACSRPQQCPSTSRGNSQRLDETSKGTQIMGKNTEIKAPSTEASEQLFARLKA